MADVQKQFLKFHDAIKLGQFDENDVLREKRDRIIKKLKEGLVKKFKEKNEPVPVFHWFNQGSYAMHTGIKPLNGDYDIDIGVVFHIVASDYPDSVEVKKWVLEALEDHTTRVEMRGPCVTVYYMRDKKVDFHVDLAIYAGGKEGKDALKLARGKLQSLPENRKWEDADPEGLIEEVNNKLSNESGDRDQYRRTIRYLKRWRQEKFSSEGNGAPPGIGLTLVAYQWFIPSKTRELFSKDVTYDDLGAIGNLVETTINNFTLVRYDENGQALYRPRVNLPVKPWTDVFVRMSDLQMTEFRSRLITLRDALWEAKNETDPVKACETLQDQFGDDFPVPEPKETAQSFARSIVHGSGSA
jgi:predicted nucleotidyltransferase